MGTINRDYGMNLCSDHYTSTPRPWYATHIEEDNVIHIQSASINEDNYVCEITYNGTEKGLQEALSNAKLILDAVNYGDIFGETLDRKLWNN